MIDGRSSLAIAFLPALLCAAAVADDPVAGDEVPVDVPAGVEVNVVEIEAVEGVEIEEGFVDFDDVVVADMGMVGGVTTEDELLYYTRRTRSLISNVCDLSEEQTQQFAKMDAKFVKNELLQAKKKNGVHIEKPNVIAMFFGAQPIERRINQPGAEKRRAIKSIDARIDEILTEPQRAKLTEERKAAEQFYHQSLAEALIERLDERLNFTDEQRETLKKELTPWVSKQNVSAESYFTGGNFYPSVPTQLLRCLDKEQLRIYALLHKANFGQQNLHAGLGQIIVEP